MEDFSKYPRYLYKYSPFNKEIINSFINNEFWFSDPKDFNDPYDCKIEVEFDFNIDDLRNHFIKTNNFYTEIIKSIKDPIKQINFIRNRYRNKLTNDQIFKKIDGIFNHNELLYPHSLIENRIRDFQNNQEKFRSEIKKESQKELRNYRLFCLSRNKNNSTMWAHYSENHKGICIKFDTKSDLNFFLFPLKVRYVNKYPKYNYIRQWDSHDTARHVLRTKHKNWSYEKEIRIIKYQDKTPFRNNGLLKINKSAIKDMYFGLKANQSDIELFKEINKKYYDNRIKVFKAKEIPYSFDIDFERIR